MQLIRKQLGKEGLERMDKRKTNDRKDHEIIARAVMFQQRDPAGAPSDRTLKIARKNSLGLELMQYYPEASDLMAQEQERFAAYEQALAETSSLLERYGIPHIYIKFRKHYHYYDSNVDVVVRPSGWQGAIAALEREGYVGNVMFKEPDKIMFSRPDRKVSVHLHPGVTWNGVPYFGEQALWENSRPSADYPAREMDDTYDFLINLAHNVFENYEVSLGDVLYFQRHLQACQLDVTEMEQIAAANGWQYGFQKAYAQALALTQAWEHASHEQIPQSLLAYPYRISAPVLARAYSERIASNLAGRRFGPALREIYAYPSFYALKRRHDLPILNRF
jgi:hypothetical protein